MPSAWGEGSWGYGSWSDSSSNFTATVSESGAGAETSSTRRIALAAVAPAARGSTLQTGGTRLLSAASEQAASQESFVAGRGLPVSTLVLAFAADEGSSSPNFRRSFSDSARGSDTTATLINALRTVLNTAAADTTTLALRTVQPGSWGAGGWSYGPWGSPFTLYEAVLGERIEIQDTPATASGNQRSVFETVYSAEQAGAGVALRSAAAESAAGASQETATAQQGGAVFEAAAGAEVSSGLTRIDRSVLEIAAAQALEVPLSDTARGVNENAAAMEMLAPGLQVSTAMEEAGTVSEAAASDTIDAPEVFVAEGAQAHGAGGVGFFTMQATSVEGAQAGLALLPGLVYFVTLEQEAQISDQAWFAYLWNPLSDAQSPGWQGPAAAPAGAWTPVSDNQAANWQNASDAQAGLWVPVVDAQNAPWGQININP
jgi:hypothetical protein